MKISFIKKVVAFIVFVTSAGVVSATSYDYTITWTSGSNTTTGGITFNTSSIANSGTSSTIAPIVSAFSFTANGQTYSLTSTPAITGLLVRAPAFTLDPSNTSNIKSSFTDINFFTFAGSPSCSGSNTTPQGLIAFTVRTCSGGTSTDWVLSSIVFGSSSSGPSLAYTQSSVANTAQALQSTYTLQNSVLANSFSYDCTVFGENNVCVSAGGRNTAVSAANGLNNTSALLIAAYRALPSVRIGAYADQNLSVNNGGSTVNLGNNTPLIGLFAAWNERQDGTGSELKVSAAYGQKNTTVTRGVVGSGSTASEAGSGGSQLNSQGFQVLGKHGFGVMQDVVVSPYVGIRYTQNNMGGYTEGSSATVTAPLTYSSLNTNATTALAGVGASYRGIPQTNLFASAGVETDTNTSAGSYSATGVSGLVPVNFNPNPVKTRATATLGATYDVEKNQRLGVTGIYRQESYQAVSTTTVMATYTVGF